MLHPFPDVCQATRPSEISGNETSSRGTGYPGDMADLMLRARRVAVEAQISENIAALCHRAGTNQTRVAGAIGLTIASMSRKMAGGPWLYSEVATIAELLGVTTDELAGTLPSREEWRARR